MTNTGRDDVTSQEAKDIHEAAQEYAAKNPDTARHDEVSCWCCCFDCDFDHAATIANDQAAGVDSVY